MKFFYLKFSFTFVLLIFLTNSYAATKNSDTDKFVRGEIGDIFLGMNLSDLEKNLQRKLDIDFMGDFQYGVAISDAIDFEKLNLKTFLGIRQDAIELIFNSKTDTVKLIAVPLLCTAMSRFNPKVQYKKNIDKFGSWIAVNNTKRIGKIIKPTCHVFVGYK